MKQKSKDSQKNFSKTEKIKLYNLLIQKYRLAMPEKMKEFNKKCRYKFAYGGRGGGKSQSVAKMLLKIGNEQKVRVLCTREIQNSIKDSVHTLLSDEIKELNYTDYDVTRDTIRNLRTGAEFIFAGMYGQDRKQTMKSMANVNYVWVEEAQSVSKGSLEILDPTIRAEASELWFTYNMNFPDDPITQFMYAIPDDKKIVVKINWYENPYLPDDLRELAERHKADYLAGKNPDFLHIWEGEPINLSDRTIIKLNDVIAAMQRPGMAEGRIRIGVDVARYGSDRTVLTRIIGTKMLDIKAFNGLSITDIACEVKLMAQNERYVEIRIDDTGVGGGLTDVLRKDDFNVLPINFGELAIEDDKYANRISEMWKQFRDNIADYALIDNAELKTELISREYKFDNKDRFRVESKDEYKKRGFRSPDLADSVLLAYYNFGSRSIDFIGDAKKID